MYIYFDNNGVLKEIITERPFRAGDSQRDKIYIYWDGEHTPTAGWVKYRKADGTLTTETQFSLTKVNKTLPTEPLRNLKYFSYEHTYIDGGTVKTGYPFYELTVPSAVLSSSTSEEIVPTANNMCVANVRFVFSDESIDNLGSIVFSVETSIGILTDGSIDETQYNYIIAKLSQKFGLDNLRSVKVDELPETGETGTIYYVKIEDEEIYNVYFWNTLTAAFVFLGTTSCGLYTQEEGGAFESEITEEINDFKTDVNEQLDDMTETIEGLGNLEPSGTDTSTNILAFTTNKGIYIGTDTGNWYYWNGTQYVAGGTFISSAIDDELSETSTNTIQNKVITNYVMEITQSMTNQNNKIEQYYMQNDIISCGYYLSFSDFKFKPETSNYKASIIDISSLAGKSLILKIKANENGNIIRALKKTPLYDQVSAVFVDNTQPILYTLSANEEKEIEIPEGTEWIEFTKKSSIDYTPKYVGIYEKFENPSGFSNYTKFDNKYINKESLISCGFTILNGKWIKYSQHQYCGALIPVSQFRGKKIAIKSGSLYMGYTFTKNAPVNNEDVQFANSYHEFSVAVENSISFIDIPSDAVYLFVYMFSLNVDYRPEWISVIDDTTNEIMQSHEQLNSMGNEIKICTYNIGHFALGVSKNSTIDSSVYSTKLEQFKELIYKTINPDIIGLNEYSKIFGNDGDSNKIAQLVLFNKFPSYKVGVQRNYSCNSLFGYANINNITIKEYECLEDETITHTSAILATDYYYIDCDFNLKGRNIKLVITHMAFDNNRPEVLQTAQINELITKYANYDNVIIMGDFNITIFSTLSLFTSAGYSMANDGTYITYPAGNWALDNIIVKGLTISNVGMVQSDLSDHYPLYCTLKIN